MASVGLLAFAEPVTKLFVGTRTDLLELSMRASRFAAIIYIPAGINILMSGYYTAIDKPIESATIAILRSLVFIVCGLTVLPSIWGLDGVWATMPGAELMTLVACLVIVLRNKNKAHTASQRKGKEKQPRQKKNALAS